MRRICRHPPHTHICTHKIHSLDDISCVLRCNPNLMNSFISTSRQSEEDRWGKNDTGAASCNIHIQPFTTQKFALLSISEHFDTICSASSYSHRGHIPLSVLLNSTASKSLLSAILFSFSSSHTPINYF
jgi:hypothetical protein